MDRTRMTALAVAIAAASGVAAISHVYAGDAARDRSELLAQAAPAPEAGRAEHGPRGRHMSQGGPGANRPQLFTPEERAQFELKMKGAKTPEERAALRKEMRAAFEQRAKEKGVTPGQRPERAQLTQRDHQRFQERWANAKTSEEREALRKEMLATVDQRARDGGVRDGGAMRPHDRRAEGGQERRRPGGSMAQLVTPQEREQFRDKMKNAKDRDERRKLMQEMHAMVEARAKEKGITLPERGRHEHRPMRDPHPDGNAAPRPQG